MDRSTVLGEKDREIQRYMRTARTNYRHYKDREHFLSNSNKIQIGNTNRPNIIYKINSSKIGY